MKPAVETKKSVISTFQIYICLFQVDFIWLQEDCVCVLHVLHPSLQVVFFSFFH